MLYCAHFWHGVNPDDFAASKLELMGISIHKQSLYDIENNKRTVKDYELFGIAYALEIDVNDLLKDIKDKF